MAAERGPRSSLYVALFLVLLAAAAFLWLPTWWESREFREAEKIAGVGAPILAGALTDARGKVDSGKTSEEVVAAIGRPSIAVATEGTSRHDIWTYYYGDGTLTLNLTDGVVVRIATEYGPPNIPTSRRPR